MKQIKACILILVIGVSIVICKKQIFIEDTKADEQILILPVNTEKTDNTDFSQKDIKPLERLDFSVTDRETCILLDSLYCEFEIDKTEKKLDNNYVGEVYSGDFVYKVFMHSYEDFDLYVSNTNYNLKKRNFDEYYITQITLKNNVFETYRGIKIASDKEEIINMYGVGMESVEDGISSISYVLSNMKIKFIVGENQKVEEIILSIIISNL